MDVGLRSEILLVMMVLSFCFNPCFNGCRSAIKYNGCNVIRWLVSILVLMDVGLRLIIHIMEKNFSFCFNPCFNGCRSAIITQYTTSYKT